MGDCDKVIDDLSTESAVDPEDVEVMCGRSTIKDKNVERKWFGENDLDVDIFGTLLL